MFDESLRTLKEHVLLPAVKAVARTGVSPTQLTLLGFVAGLGCCVAAAVGWWWLASALWWVGRILDGLDGSLARLTGQQSDFGGYVDILCDFTVYSLVPLAVVWRASAEGVAGQGAWLLLALLLGAYFVNAAGLFMLSSLLEKRAVGKKLTSVAMPRGLVEGAETMVVYQLFLLFPHSIALLMAAFCAAVVATILYRLHWAYHKLL
jgi:phosphatidylglycerophosphate synthase